MTPFSTAAEKLSAAVDAVYGETFTFLPRKSGGDVNAPFAADPDRAPLEFTASLINRYARADSRLVTKQGVSAEKPGHASARPQLSFDRAALPYEARRGDRVRRAKDGSVYVLAELRVTEDRRIVADINRI